MLSHLRPYVGIIKRILAWPFLRLGFSATQVSVLGVGLAVLAAACARVENFDLAFWTALVAVLTDLVDGEVARVRKAVSPRGNYLDAMLDRTRECILLLGLLPLAPNLVALALVGTCLTSFAKARCALVRLMDNRDWPGVGDHPDRAALILIAYLFAPASSLALGLLVMLTWTCFARRARHACELIDQADESELLPYLRTSDRPLFDTNDRSNEPDHQT